MVRKRSNTAGRLRRPIIWPGCIDCPCRPALIRDPPLLGASSGAGTKGKLTRLGGYRDTEPLRPAELKEGQ
jgi:hypothetical protein